MIFLNYIVERIILLSVNFILEKSFTYCTNAYSYFEKGYKYISTYKSQCFKEIYYLMSDHTYSSAGRHAARGPRVGQPCYSLFK